MPASSTPPCSVNGVAIATVTRGTRRRTRLLGLDGLLGLLGLLGPLDLMLQWRDEARVRRSPAERGGGHIQRTTPRVRALRQERKDR
eukprot:scaffold25817_cov65-Phaeocystis_antarctica.AAC.7